MKFYSIWLKREGLVKTARCRISYLNKSRKMHELSFRFIARQAFILVSREDVVEHNNA